MTGGRFVLCLVALCMWSTRISCTISASYPGMTCAWTGTNNWDSPQTVDRRSEFLSGQYSTHDNGREDRQYKWKYCRVSGDSSNIQTGTQVTLPNTWYDWSWRRGCGGNTALNYVYSSHDNGREDRWFRFKCRQVNAKYKLDSCAWTTNWVNSWDGVLNYQCNNNGLIRTVESYHDNHREDRRWKFECCRVAYSDFDADEITPMDCYKPNYYENDWDGVLNIPPSGYFMNGIYTYHDNHREDRLYKFRRCRPRDSVTNAYTSVNTLSMTGYDAEWRKSCSGYNNGNSAIVGIYSHHSNSKEDRQFSITCGHLDTSRYGLNNCGWTGDISNYDAVNNFDCPGNGVIRGMWSKHRNENEDRLFRFECCTVVPGKFGESKGSWKRVLSCLGPCDEQYSVSVGTTTSRSETTTKEYRLEFTQSVSLGYTFSYLGSSGSVDYTVTSTEAQTTSNSLTSSIERSTFTTQTITCTNAYLFQWVQEAYDYTNTQDVSMYTFDFLCTNNQFPQCPLGFCNTVDCKECREGWSE